MSDGWYKRYPDHFRKSTYGMSAAARGVYNDLIDHYYLTAEPLPANDHALANIGRCTLAEWAEVRPEIEGHFMADANLWHHPKIDNLLAARNEKRALKSEIGRQNAEKRWKKKPSRPKAVNAKPMQTDANGMQVPCKPMLRDKSIEDSPPISPPDGGDGAGPIPWSEIQETWNRICGDVLRSISGVSEQRRRKFRPLWRDDLMSDLDFWAAYCRVLRSTPKLIGERPMEGGRYPDWRASFDWAIKRASYEKVMEGQYTDPESGRTSAKGVADSPPDHEALLREHPELRQRAVVRPMTNRR